MISKRSKTVPPDDFDRLYMEFQAFCELWWDVLEPELDLVDPRAAPAKFIAFRKTWAQAIRVMKGYKPNESLESAFYAWPNNIKDGIGALYKRERKYAQRLERKNSALKKG
jgi:hypothetical protein